MIMVSLKNGPDYVLGLFMFTNQTKKPLKYTTSFDLSSNTEKYFLISLEKEFSDALVLADQINNSTWLKDSKQKIVIVNCSPDYSSVLSMLLAHKLSVHNNHIPLPLFHLQMPYPNSTPMDTKECHVSTYELFGKLAALDNPKILFVDAGVLRGLNFTALRDNALKEFPQENIAFACLYLQNNSVFVPEFYVEKFDPNEQGGLMFHWENPANPMWNY